MTMTEQNAMVAIYPTHTQVESAVHKLQQAGFDLKKLSIVGKDYQTEEHVVGCYTVGDRMVTWGSTGAFWGGVWGLLFGSAFFWVPGIGPLLMAGPLAAAVAAVLEGALIVGGLSAIGAAMASLGIPEASMIQYETELRAGKFIVVAHGSAADAAQAKDILTNTAADLTAIHGASSSQASEPSLAGQM